MTHYRGGVDQDVHSVEALNRVIDQGLDLVTIRDIGEAGVCSMAGRHQLCDD